MNAETTDRFPTFRRLPGLALLLLRKTARAPVVALLWCGRLLFCRRAFAIYGGLVTAGFLGWTGYNWYWGHRWKAEKERLAAAGETLDLAKLISPLPPDHNNFFGTSALRHILDKPEQRGAFLPLWWTPKITTVPARLPSGKEVDKEVKHPGEGAPLAAWCEYYRTLGMLPSPPAAEPGAPELLADHRHDALIQELRAAARRPESRMPTEPLLPPVGVLDGPYEGERLHSDALRAITGGLRIHARACVAAGDPEGAVEDARALFAVTRARCATGTLLSMFITGADVSMLAPLIREGMIKRTWTVETLETLLAMDIRPDVIRGFELAWRVERARVLYTLENHESAIMTYVSLYEHEFFRRMVIRAWPAGWYLREAVSASDFIDGMSAAFRPDSGEVGIRDRLAGLADKRAWTLMPSLGAGGLRWRESDLDLLARPLMAAEVNRLATRLELHRLRHGSYPGTLEEMEHTGGEPIPTGVDGRPFRYSLDAGGETMRLWTPSHRRPASAPADRPHAYDFQFSSELPAAP